MFEERTYAYRELFRLRLNREYVHDIREALIQQFVLGCEDFKYNIKNRWTRTKIE